MLGLYRPTETHSYRQVWNTQTAPSYRLKMTTWLACYVVDREQAFLQGIPPSICADAYVLDALKDPIVDSTLSQLCRVHQLFARSLRETICNGLLSSGLQHPDTRL